MKEFQSIADFVAYLQTRQAAVQHEQKEGMRAAAEMLLGETRKLIGTEDPAWPPLAEATIWEKLKGGYLGRISPTDPLLRTGHMRGSVEFSASDHKIVLGSDDPAAVEHEYGTRWMPARPVFSTIMFRYGHAAVDIVAQHVMAVVYGFRRPDKHHRPRSD